MPYGYELRDAYGSLGPLTDDRIAREVYSRHALPSDPDGVVAPGFPVGRDFTISIPQLDLTKGFLMQSWTGITDGFNRVFLHCFYRNLADASHIHRGPVGGARWNNTTKVLTFQLTTNNPTVGMQFFGYMFA